ncbi:MAG: hypothetical protein A2493_03800 [Candidatus Magasanikbacteria bacterium RIFOXYC12_FULL_33_11]|uniref:Uncharacterized protein n=1 Tax=Candidatus Magasanikbacteria bacterium RIFOXYC12_FULL_33_11 TaxID=1798701 RepID=A0A1F6NM74_9BACT|nr:MAG: hypothetical protein A2493_03800 [Candidatus Magasanikbacteria bacterium RIFOXYC12_FULL_33_11]
MTTERPQTYRPVEETGERPLTVEGNLNRIINLIKQKNFHLNETNIDFKFEKIKDNEIKIIIILTKKDDVIEDDVPKDNEIKANTPESDITKKRNITLIYNPLEKAGSRIKAHNIDFSSTKELGPFEADTNQILKIVEDITRELQK